MPERVNNPATRVMMMPRDTNPTGTIFGGVILSYIDQAGAEEAKRRGCERVVTVAMDQVVFHQPVFVGDLVSFYTELLEIGRTSMRVQVTVEAARVWCRDEVVRVTEAVLTYVNVNPDRRPVPIPRTRGEERT